MWKKALQLFLFNLNAICAGGVLIPTPFTLDFETGNLKNGQTVGDTYYYTTGLSFSNAVAVTGLNLQGSPTPFTVITGKSGNANLSMIFSYGASGSMTLYYAGLSTTVSVIYTNRRIPGLIIKLPATTGSSDTSYGVFQSAIIPFPSGEVSAVFLEGRRAVFDQFTFTPAARPIFQDPAVSGFRGQFFHFEAPDGWYAAISEPHMQFNWRLTEFTAKVAKTYQDYITGVAAIFFDDNGDELQRVLMEFKDVKKPSQGCQGGAMDPCLHRGNLRLAVDDTVIDRPGEYDLFPGAKLYAINSPLECSYLNGMLHAIDVKPITVADERRKLSVLTGIEAFARTSDTSNEKCSDWLNERQEKGDIYSQYSYLTTVIIITPRVSLRVEFRENAKEEWYWIDYQYQTPTAEDESEVWSGIHGETKQGTFDKNGVEIIRGRSVLSGQNDDYRVEDGAFGTDFAARIR